MINPEYYRVETITKPQQCFMVIHFKSSQFRHLNFKVEHNFNHQASFIPKQKILKPDNDIIKLLKSVYFDLLKKFL